jgi:hypothetical protein
MQLRPGVYRIGEAVEIRGSFFNSNNQPIDADDIKVTIKKPPPDNSVSGPFPVNISDGVAYFEFDPDIIGTWKVRMECSFPKSAVIESKFEVVPHKS